MLRRPETRALFLPKHSLIYRNLRVRKGLMRRRRTRARIGAIGMAAALAVLAYAVVPTSAGAAILCEANQELCENTNVHPPELVALSANPVFNFGGLGTVKCESIKIEASGNASEEQVHNFWNSNCGEGCTISALNLPYKMELASTSGGNGTVTLKNSGKGTPSFSAQCGEVKCVYKAEGMQPLSVAANRRRCKSTNR